MINKKAKKQLFNKKRADFTLGLTAFGLMVLGVVMIYSASVFVGQRYFADPKIFFVRQLVSLIFAIIIWIIAQQIDYRLWKKWAIGLFIISIGLLLLVFFFPEVNGSRSWIILGTLRFQPAELAKLALIIYLAAWFDRRSEEIKKLTVGFLPFAIIICLIGLLVLSQPDLGTFIIIFLIAVSLYFFANAPLPHFLVAGLLALVGFWSMIWQVDYRRERILTFLDPAKNTLDASYHIQNILIAVGSGGWWGLGFGASKQKRLFLPEPHTDSIFSVIVEETGFLRSVLVIFALGFIITRIFQISLKINDPFGRFLAAGIASWIAWQSLINLGAMLGLIPLTGIPLPFVSYGGSSLVTLAFALGIVMNISKQIDK